ncbi:MAG: hypothetical protein IT384_09200 [Deltaproteobacteria bacterium]|nr:hypothetical protein [Deltaproteobacteria bacterium]
MSPPLRLQDSTADRITPQNLRAGVETGTPYGPLAAPRVGGDSAAAKLDAANNGAFQRAKGATYELRANVISPPGNPVSALEAVFVKDGRLVGTKKLDPDGRLTVGPDEFPGAKMNVVASDVSATWSATERGATGATSVGPVAVTRKPYEQTTLSTRADPSKTYRFEAKSKPFSTTNNEPLEFSSLQVEVRDPKTNKVTRYPLGEDGTLVLDGAKLPPGATVGLTADEMTKGFVSLTASPKNEGAGARAETATPGASGGDGALSALEDARARPVLLAATDHINRLGGIDEAYRKYADPSVGGITKDGVDEFLRDADVGYVTRKLATGPMHAALDGLGSKNNVVTEEELSKAWKLMQAMSIRVKG